MRTEVDPAPHGITPATPACPACATPLTRLADSTSMMAGCARCGGVWLDAPACQVVVHGELDDVKRQFLRTFDEGSPEPEPTPSSDTTMPPGRRACPICAADLAPVHLRDPALTVSACAEHGTFFARRALLRVVDAAAIRGVAQPAPSAPASSLRRADYALFMLGGAVFLTSMFLPSLRFGLLASGSDEPGIFCAIGGFVAIEERPTIFLAALGNLVLLTSPTYAWALRARGSMILSLLAAFFGVIAVSVGFDQKVNNDLLAGYYVWMLWFFAVAAGFLVRALDQRKQTAR